MNIQKSTPRQPSLFLSLVKVKFFETCDGANVSARAAVVIAEIAGFSLLASDMLEYQASFKQGGLRNSDG